jgi:hypothetical protein
VIRAGSNATGLHEGPFSGLELWGGWEKIGKLEWQFRFWPRWDRSAEWSQFRSGRRQRRRWLDRARRNRCAPRRRSAPGDLRGVAPDPGCGVTHLGADGLARRSSSVSRASWTGPPPIHSPRTNTRRNRMARPASRSSSQGAAADSGPEPPGQREPADQGTDRLNGLAYRPDLLKDGLDIPAINADRNSLRIEHPIRTLTHQAWSRAGQV